MSDDKRITAPFKKNGSLWHYPPTDQELNNPRVSADKRPTLEWREVGPWEDTMLVVGQQRGRSAAIFLLVGSDGKTSYPMFMSDASEMMRSATIDRGKITGRWAVVKKGRNFGLRYLPESGATDE